MPVRGHSRVQDYQRARDIAQESAEYWHGMAIWQEAEIERLTALIPSECANPHSRAKNELTGLVEWLDKPNRPGDAANAPGHGTEEETSMHEDRTQSIIGRERGLIDALTTAIRDSIGGPAPSKRTLAQLRRHRASRTWSTARGAAFEVQIAAVEDGKPTGHIVRVTVELDRFEAQSAG